MLGLPVPTISGIRSGREACGMPFHLAKRTNRSAIAWGPVRPQANCRPPLPFSAIPMPPSVRSVVRVKIVCSPSVANSKLRDSLNGIGHAIGIRFDAWQTLPYRFFSETSLHQSIGF